MNDENQRSSFVRTPETDEVMRRIGRNVVNFLLIEDMLKHLIAHASVQGPASQLATRMKEQQAAVLRKTMGDLAGIMMSNVLRPQHSHPISDEIEEPEVRITFTVDADVDAAFADRHDREMRSLVSARNELIHHFLPRWRSAVKGDSNAALEFLDAQMDETFLMLDRLRGWVRSMDHGRKQLAEFLASPEANRQMELSFLQRSRLVAMLGEVALRTARSDGWALLSSAGKIIKRDAPDELDDLQVRYGHRTLKNIVLAAEYFDVEDEHLANGSMRTVYRINDRYELKRRPDVEPETKPDLPSPGRS